MGVNLGMLVRKDAKGENHTYECMKIFLTSDNGELLHIINDGDYFTITTTKGDDSFIQGDELFSPQEWSKFYDYTYDLMLIVLERILLEHHYRQLDTRIPKLEIYSDYITRLKEIYLAKRNVNVV